MKLKTTVGALLDAYTLVSPTLDRKGSASQVYLTANEKSNFLYLYSTNLIAETAAKAKSIVEEPGEALVNPSKLLGGLLDLSKETPLSLTLSNGILKVNAGSVRFTVASSSEAKDLGMRLRAIPSKNEPLTVIPATELSTFLKRSFFIIPNDQTGQRVNLSSLKISESQKGEEAFATDGSIAVHVSAIQKQGKGKGFGTEGVLIPEPTLQPLMNLATKKKGETIAVIQTENKNKVFFRFADGTHLGTLVKAVPYPNLKPIVDRTQHYSFEIAREVLKQALSRASIFVSSVSNQKTLELEFDASNLSISANGDDKLADQIAITYVGEKPSEPIKLGMNINYLFNIASSSNSEKLTFGFAQDNQALVVNDNEGEDEDKINIKYIMSGVRLAK